MENLKQTIENPKQFLVINSKDSGYLTDLTSNSPIKTRVKV